MKDTMRTKSKERPTARPRGIALAVAAIAFVGCGPPYIDLCPIPPGIASRIPEDGSALHLGAGKAEGSLTGDDGRLFATQNHYDD